MAVISASSQGGWPSGQKSMHPAVYRVFQEICSRVAIRGPVLEIGAVSGPDTLLRLDALRHIGPRIGLNLEGGGACDGYEILSGNANDMSRFADGLFRTVLSNATLEHDPQFWKTLAEIHRVTASGGFIAIGVPGYAGMGIESLDGRTRPLAWLLRLCARGPLRDVLHAGTPTLGVHCYPGDYYRFSEQAMREVFMSGLKGVSVRRVLNPPRFIAWGWKP
jgi:hypothetical protein